MGPFFACPAGFFAFFDFFFKPKITGAGPSPADLPALEWKKYVGYVRLHWAEAKIWSKLKCLVKKWHFFLPMVEIRDNFPFWFIITSLFFFSVFLRKVLYYIKVSGIPGEWYQIDKTDINDIITCEVLYPHMWRYHFWDHFFLSLYSHLNFLMYDRNIFGSFIFSNLRKMFGNVRPLEQFWKIFGKWSENLGKSSKASSF